ncbi:putative RNA-directed DNA polymerase from transposon X-element, partial [Stegodyphus mimosarum]
MVKYRSDAWENFVESLSHHDSSVWRISKALKNEENVIGPIKHNNQLFYNADDIENIFASDFENQFTLNPLSNPNDINVENHVKNSIALNSRDNVNLTTPREVKNYIEELNPKKAAGYDGIGNKALKQLDRKGFVLITKIFNACIKFNYFPSIWKHAIITVITKPGENGAVTCGYRPISVLPSLAKLFEKIIINRIKKFIENKNLLKNYQFGFRSGHSTTQQVTRITEKIASHLNKKETVAALFLDIEKAFEKIWHA